MNQSIPSSMINGIWISSQVPKVVMNIMKKEEQAILFRVFLKHLELHIFMKLHANSRHIFCGIIKECRPSDGSIFIDGVTAPQENRYKSKSVKKLTQWLKSEQRVIPYQDTSNRMMFDTKIWILQWSKYIWSKWIERIYLMKWKTYYHHI